VTHIIIEGGPYATQWQKLEASGYTLDYQDRDGMHARASKQVEVRYACRACAIRVWGKPEFASFGMWRTDAVPSHIDDLASSITPKNQHCPIAISVGVKQMGARSAGNPHAACDGIERVINLINPMLRGWVNYFAVGHSSECFSFIKDWVYLFSAIIHRRGVLPPSQPGSHAAGTSRARSGFPRGYISPNFKVLTSNNPRSGT
jgi:hypothetical protein